MRPEQWIQIGLVLVAVLVVLSFIVLRAVTDSQHDKAIAQMKKPSSVAFYEDLLARSKTRDAGTEKPVASGPEKEKEDPLETIARWQCFFDKVEQRFAAECDRDRPEWVRNLYMRLPTSWTDEENAALNAFEESGGTPYDRAMGATFKSPGEWTEDERSALAGLLARNKDLVLEIRQLAAGGGPLCLLGIPQSFPNPMYCSMLLEGHALMNAAEGRYSEAVEDIVAGMRFAKALCDVPFSPIHSMGERVERDMYDTVQDAFERGKLPAELGRIIINEAYRPDRRAKFADALRGQEAASVETFKRWLNEGNMRTGLEGVDNALLERMRGWVYTSAPLRPWYNKDVTAYIEVIDRITEAAGLPYYEAKPVLEQICVDIRHLPSTRVISRGRLPLKVGIYIPLEARHEVMIDLMRIGLAVEAHYAAHGKYPATLDVVAADLCGTVPLDPLTGQPYFYQSQGNTFLLQSGEADYPDDGRRPVRRIERTVWRDRQEEG